MEVDSPHSSVPLPQAADKLPSRGVYAVTVAFSVVRLHLFIVRVPFHLFHMQPTRAVCETDSKILY